MAKMDLTARLKNSAKRAQDVTAQTHLVAVEDLPGSSADATAAEPTATEVEQVAPAATDAVEQPKPTSDAPAALKPEQRGRPASTKPRRASAKPASAAPAVAGEVAKNLALELPKSLNTRLNAHHDQSKMSFVMIVMTAVEVTYPQLQELIDKKLGRQDEPTRVSLFAKPARQRISHDEETERRTIRMTAGGLEVLDRLVEEFAAPSRTFLMIVALDTYLPSTD